MSAPWIEPADEDVLLSLYVQPRASRTEFAGPYGDALKIRLAAPPVDGAANLELIAFLAKRLRRPKASIEIVRGARGRRKTVRIRDATPADVSTSLTSP